MVANRKLRQVGAWSPRQNIASHVCRQAALHLPKGKKEAAKFTLEATASHNSATSTKKELERFEKEAVFRFCFQLRGGVGEVSHQEEQDKRLQNSLHR